MITRHALIFLLARPWSSFNNNFIHLSSAFVVPVVPPNVRLLRRQPSSRHLSSFASPTKPLLLLAKPKKAGSTVDSYQTVSVNCSKCQQRLFRYKKKNGTKSNLVKCYIERICEDSAGVLALAASKENSQPSFDSKVDANPTRANYAISNINNKNTNQKNKKRKRKQNNPTNTDGNIPPTIPPEDPSAVLVPNQLDPGYSWECPSCHTKFARSSRIHGRPALKLVGGKIRMTKK